MGMVRKARVVLGDDQVYEISRRVMLGESQTGLAKEFNVTQSTIAHLLSGKNRRSANKAVLILECANCGSPFSKTGRNQKHCRSRECSLDLKRKANDRFAPKKKRTPGIEAFLKGKDKPCMDCGGYWPDKPWRMEYDHRDPSTKLEKLKGTRLRRTKSMRSLSGDELVAEMAKCDVVCRNCHSDRTALALQSGKINTVPYKRARLRPSVPKAMEQGSLFAAAR